MRKEKLGFVGRDNRNRKPIILGITLLAFVLSGALQFAPGSQKTDPLPSWNDGAVKQSIIAFVNKITTKDGADFVPESERIATFDNDGTLWVEKPIPIEIYFIGSRIRKMVEKDPSLRQRPSFKAAVERDIPFLQQELDRALPELLKAAYSNISQDQFEAEARQFIETQHPQIKVPYTQLTYPPMLELLAYLRANQFQIWICSGGTADFMRVFAPQLYGVPPERIIGTELKHESRDLDGRQVIWRLPEIESFNDKEAKAIHIEQKIGKHPVFVAGNVGGQGDIAMMKYSKERTGASFQLLINHDDRKREFMYGEAGNNSLDAAKKWGFTVVSIKNDWKTPVQFKKDHSMQ